MKEEKEEEEDDINKIISTFAFSQKIQSKPK
jgi:hypothetical protein